ncbi:MAG: methyltransferase domain-containing protein [Planctomycetes bacterium]|nr:methyltransferase domain-containing protein [Planctomycetota bacterium]
MPATWRLLVDDPFCRAQFPDLATTLALPAEAAAPPNRLRHVRRLERGGRTFFLKVFTATQWKNRLRFAVTQPPAAGDAERELRVTEALRAAGFAAPEPIAIGRDGAAGYYLCAALPGEPLLNVLRRGDATASLLRAAAEHCGALLAAGFRLPDLSADHVFVTGQGFAVLDLHNGGVGTAGPPPRRLLMRVLRRFARSVRTAPVGRNAAMRFAARLLRAARTGRAMRRHLLVAAQPFGTAARYERDRRSAAYAERSSRRDDAERRLLARVWPGEPGERVLDLPCGTGRLLPFLESRGHTVAQADGAAAMLREAAARGRAADLAVQADALAMPFAERSFDGVVMFRFLHHLPPDAARRALAEACRVARRFVVVSFFHPISLHHLQRRARSLLGQPTTRFAQPFAELRAVAARQGFRVHRRAAQLPFARDLWLASFVRDA